MPIMRVNCAAEFMVDAVINTDLTTEQFDLLTSDEKRELIWDSLVDSWDNTGNKLRDAEVRAIDCAIIDVDSGMDVEGTQRDLDGKQIN